MPFVQLLPQQRAFLGQHPGGRSAAPHAAVASQELRQPMPHPGAIGMLSAQAGHKSPDRLLSRGGHADDYQLPVVQPR